MGELWVSASQLKTADNCLRSWYFYKVLKLPVFQGTKYGAAFGACLHLVAERFFADETELFPEGWAYSEDHGVLLEDTDQFILEDLVNEAIKTGLWTQLPGLEIEKDFKTYYDEARGIRFVGYMDMWAAPRFIGDHKATVRRDYIYSQNKLRQDLQALFYGASANLMHRDAGTPAPEAYELEWKYYVRDPDNEKKRGVKPVRIELTQEDIREALEHRIEPLLQLMLMVREDVKDWREIDDPPNPAKSCRAYGQCPFLSICGRTETVEMYTKRVEKVIARAQGESPMGTLKDRMAKMAQAKTSGGNSAPAATPTNTEPSAELAAATTAMAEAPKEEPAPESAMLPKPPWAKDDCIACEGDGWNTKGNPCRACTDDGKAHDMSQYEIGKFEWKLKEPEPEVKPEPEKKEQPKAAAGKTTAQKLTVYFACRPSKLPTKNVINATELYKTCLEAAESELDGHSYWQVEAFERRDKMRQLAIQALAGAANNTTILSDCRPECAGDPDFASFLTTLKLQATTYIS